MRDAELLVKAFFVPAVQDDEGWILISRTFRAAAARLGGYLAKRNGVKDRALAKHLIDALRRCSYDVFSRIALDTDKALCARHLLFAVYDDQTSMTEEEKVFGQPVDLVRPYQKIALPYAADLRSFYIPVSDNARIAVNLTAKKVVPIGSCNKGVREALDGRGGKGALGAKARRTLDEVHIEEAEITPLYHPGAMLGRVKRDMRGILRSGV